jgi:hypothetical protein
VRAVFARQDRDKVLGGPAKNAHCWGLFCGGIWGVPILEDCLLEVVDVQVTVRASISHDQAFDRFYCNLSSTVAVWVSHRAEAVVDTPVL